MKTNLSRTHQLLADYDQQLRIDITYPEARKELTKDVVRFARQAPGMSFISYTFAEDPDLERVIDEQVEYFVSRKLPFTWKVYEHDQRPILEAKLVTRGFVRDDDDPGQVMILEVNQAVADLFRPGKGDIRKIEAKTRLEDVVSVLDQVYGNDNRWVHERLGGHLEVPGYLSVYVTYVDNLPASVAWTYFPPGDFALLFAGSTIADFRKQGLYTRLLAHRLREIRARGYRVAVVEAGSMSRPIVAKHGFTYLTTQYDYEWKEQK